MKEKCSNIIIICGQFVCHYFAFKKRESDEMEIGTAKKS